MLRIKRADLRDGMRPRSAVGRAETLQLAEILKGVEF